MSQDSNNDTEKPEGHLTAWDIETPVPTMFDARVAGVLDRLRRGDANPIAREIEQGRLEYVARFLTEEDSQRLARTLRTGSPLTQAEKRKTRKLEKSRDARTLARVCYWKAKGLPLFSHTSQHTAIHQAAIEYSANHIKGAPARTPESIYKHVWLPAMQSAEPLELTLTQGLLNSFIQGLTTSEAHALVTTERFIWFGESFLSGGQVIPLPKATTNELDSMLDAVNPACQHYREKVKATRSFRTFALLQSSGQD